METWDVRVVVREYRNNMGFNSCVAQLGGIKAKSARQAALLTTKRGYKTFFIFKDGKQVFKSINGKWSE